MIQRGARDRGTGPGGADESAAAASPNLGAAPDGAWFRDVADHAPTVLWTTDATGACTYLNGAWYAYTGQSEAEALGLGWLDAVHPQDRPEAERVFLDAHAARRPFRHEYRLRRADGVYRWAVDLARPRFAADGAFLGFVGSVIDIHVRREAEDRLRQSEARLRGVFGTVPVGIIISEAPSGRIVAGNPQIERILRHPIIRSPDVASYGEWTAFHADGRPVEGHEYPLARAMATGEPAEGEYRYRRGDGTLAWIRVIGAPVHDGETGAVTGGVVAVLDTDKEKRAEQELRRSTGELEAAVGERTRERDRIWRNSRDLLLVAGRDGTIRAANPAWGATLGYHEEELVGQRFDRFILPEDVGPSHEAMGRATREDLPTFENRYRHKDGSVRWLSWTAALEGDSVYGIARDITADKAREAELAEAQEQLRQAQKMEAVGQLTGGIAHDFNNLLQVVIGNLEILHRGLPADAARLRRSADNAMSGARRAAVLTARLLAFSRRQPLAPRPVDANGLVAGMSELLGRTLGETVRIETALADGLWRAEADPNQLESAILNLAVNARDAMPDGGTLAIETANARLDSAHAARNADAKPGPYVMIAVSDTGSGMDKETMDRVFEPFFTTKEVGKGTGLGLSQVYGFVQQSGGHVRIRSKPGEGTTVRMYLPRSPDGAAAEGAEEGGEAAAAPEGSRAEAVLVVEDSAEVRAYSAEVLRELGYRVLEAADGPSALDLLGRPAGARVDLLFADVILPGGMTGTALAERARALRPGLKVLFTTGYARSAADAASGRPDPGTELIAKPFTYAELASRVRAVLDGPGTAGRDRGAP
jgi:PAS domain S-box-containing protein